MAGARMISLLELMLVMVILVISMGGLGVKGLAALRQHRFESAVDEVVSKLNLAQHLMLCCRANVTCKIDQQGDHYTLEMVSDDNLPDSFQKVTRGRTILRGVTEVSFQGREELPLLLNFSRESAPRMPQGVLTFSSQAHHLAHVLLPGHFTQIAKHHGNPPTPPELAPPVYPEHVAQATFSSP